MSSTTWGAVSKRTIPRDGDDERRHQYEQTEAIANIIVPPVPLPPLPPARPLVLFLSRSHSISRQPNFRPGWTRHREGCIRGKNRLLGDTLFLAVSVCCSARAERDGAGAGAGDNDLGSVPLAWRKRKVDCFLCTGVPTHEKEAPKTTGGKTKAFFPFRIRCCQGRDPALRHHAVDPISTPLLELKSLRVASRPSLQLPVPGTSHPRLRSLRGHRDPPAAALRGAAGDEPV